MIHLSQMPQASQARDKLALHWGRHVLSHLVRPDAPHPAPVALMVPLAPKDAARARVSIPLMRRRIAHPVWRTVIVAPDDPGLRALAAELGAAFVDETAPLAAHLGEATAAALPGWHRQQFLKLLAPEVAETENVVAMDADTYPQLRTAFLDGEGRLLLLRGDRNLSPFHRFTEAMIGPCPGGRISFETHTMLFRRPDLAGLRAAIEARHDRPWHVAMLEAIARLPYGAMSEFDLLGHWLLRDAPERIRMRYYAGIKISEGQFAGREPLPRWKRRFRLVSNHQR